MDKNKLLKKLNLSTYIAIDFETTGLDPIKDKIIEVAVIKFIHGKPKEKFTTLINPNIQISPFITEITGINNTMVSNAPKEGDIIDELLEFIGDYPLVAHNIRFDWAFLIELCKRYNKDIPSSNLYDTLQLARCVLFEHPVFNLAALSEHYGLDSSGSHRAEKDTENCGFVLLSLLDELISYPLESISKIISVIEKFDIPNKTLFIDLGNALLHDNDYRVVANKNIDKKPNDKSSIYYYDGKNDIENISAADVFAEGGLLSKKYDWYENRINQIEYANICDKIVHNSGIGVLEAGTGLGKSMAYLFSAIKRKYQKNSRGPVIISCNTKHLQNQLFYKDLPQLSSVLNTSISAILLKGRKNYICKTRFEWLINDNDILSNKNIEAIIPILFWLESTKTGDISECNGFLNSRMHWIISLICSDKGFCTGDICSKNQGCFYGDIRKKLFDADIIVANHALLLAEVKSKGIFPEHDSIIIDEAHNLIKTAYDQFKIALNHNNVIPLLKSIDPMHRSSKRWNNIINNIIKTEPSVALIRDSISQSLGLVKTSFELFMQNLAINNKSRFKPEKAYQDRPIIKSIDDEYATVYNELFRLINSSKDLLLNYSNLRKVVQKIDPTKKDYRFLHSVLDRGYDGIISLIETINIITQNQNKEWVYWIEGDYLKGISKEDELRLSLQASEIDISIKLKDNIFNRFNSLILTSATIKVDDSFNYFLSRNGLSDNDELIVSDFNSPFSYSDQVEYYQYNGMKDIAGDPFELSEFIYYIHKTFQKRTMVLFTSVKMLSDVAKNIKEKPESKDIPLFAQSKGASKPSIINGMHLNKNGLLFGTNSFWEGVDFPGELLEILIVVKLPFDVPTDPMIKSYSGFLDRGGVNSFMNYTVPECAIKYRQGFGRLIRTIYDSGIFISLDNRITNKRYGEIFLNTIPVDPINFSDHRTIEN